MASIVQLHFSNNSPRNAILYNSEGQAIYKIVTPKKLGHRTSTVSKIIPNTTEGDMQDRFEEIGQIEWHTFNKTLLRTGGIETEFEGSIMTLEAAFSRHRVFTAEDGHVYRWYLGKSGMHAPVLEEMKESKKIIAKFHERKYGIFSKRRQAYLEIFEGGNQFMDQIIFTFMYMEKLRRDRVREARRGGH